MTTEEGEEHSYNHMPIIMCDGDAYLVAKEDIVEVQTDDDKDNDEDVHKDKKVCKFICRWNCVYGKDDVSRHSSAVDSSSPPTHELVAER